ncbi:hypothetical protein BDR04DRAFT_1093663, partial [Suillus decipiens]
NQTKFYLDNYRTLTDAQLAGSSSLNCKQSHETQNQTSSKPYVNAKAMFSVERESAIVIEWI